MTSGGWKIKPTPRLAASSAATVMGVRPARTPAQDWRSTMGRIERLEWVRVALRTDWKWRGGKYQLARLTKLSVKQTVRLARPMRTMMVRPM